MIDLNKPLVTRTDAEVKIYFVYREGEYPVHGAYKDNTGIWRVAAWTIHGEYYVSGLNHHHDLRNLKKEILILGYMNIYPESSSKLPVFHLIRDAADQAAQPDRVACISIKVEGVEGEGI